MFFKLEAVFFVIRAVAFSKLQNYVNLSFRKRAFDPWFFKTIDESGPWAIQDFWSRDFDEWQ